MSSRLQTLLACLPHAFSPKRRRCPSCDCARSTLVSRKHLITALRRCADCSLLFRTPTVSSAENAHFYQETYDQGFDSDTPAPAELARLLSTRFSGTGKDYAPYIAILSALGVPPGARLLDFGCSWGYGSWQLREAGYEVTSFEISRPRCRYAREKLGVNAHDHLAALGDQPFDVFFSAHVLEHVPSVAATLAFAKSKLKKDGLFLAFTPNGSQPLRHAHPALWQNLWGHVHPNFLDDVFYRRALPRALLASSPYDYAALAQTWSAPLPSTPFPLDGVELMAAARLP